MKKLQLLIGIAISAIFLYFSVKGINWKESIQIVLHASYIFLIPAILLHFLSFYIRAGKWSIITSKFKQISAIDLFPLICIGLAMNNVLPLRAGEIGRVVIMANKFKLSSIKATLTILAERIFDLLGLLLITLIFIHLHTWPGHVYTLINLASLFVILFILLTPVCIIIIKKIIYSIMQKHNTGYIQKVYEKIIELEDIFHIYRSKKIISYSMLLSIALWLIEGISYFLIAQSFHLPLSFIDIILVCVLVNIASAIPSTSGYIGTFEFFATSLLVFLGITKTLALSYVIILHLELLIPVTIVGVYFYFAKKYYTYISYQQK